MAPSQETPPRPRLVGPLPARRANTKTALTSSNAAAGWGMTPNPPTVTEGHGIAAIPPRTLWHAGTKKRHNTRWGR